MSIKINRDTGTFDWFCLLALAQLAAQARLIRLIIKQQYKRITPAPTGLLNGVIAEIRWVCPVAQFQAQCSQNMHVFFSCPFLTSRASVAQLVRARDCQW